MIFASLVFNCEKSVYEHLGLKLPSYHFWSVLQMPVDEAA